MKTCKVNAEIIDTVGAHCYKLRIKDDFRHGQGIYVTMKKENVTDIREEVDWREVKRLTWIMYRGRNSRWKAARFSYYDVGVKHLYFTDGLGGVGLADTEAILLTDWLKEHGGQDG